MNYTEQSTIINDFAIYWRSAVMSDAYAEMKNYLQQEEYKGTRYSEALETLCTIEPEDLGFIGNGMEGF